jgi:hypothetical protein
MTKRHQGRSFTARSFTIRTLQLTILILAGIACLCYFPLARIRAARTGATILPSVGKPLVNLKAPQTPKITYTGDASAVAALQGGAVPTALAAADFNADGAPDVVAGYSTKSGGVLALYKGNPDAFAPTDLTLYQKAMKGSVPPTFLAQAVGFTLPESPDLIATGDFNRDGKPDVLVAARGGNLYLLAGDGRGSLSAPQPVALADQVTALAVHIDGHVAVSTDGRSGPQVTILAAGVAGLTAEKTFPLPVRGESMAWGSLGGGIDLVVGAGNNLVFVYSALTANPQTETVNLSFQVKALALGDYIWDHDGRTEISLLAADGTIHIFRHGTLNTAPLTPADKAARRATRGRQLNKAAALPMPDPTAPGGWAEAKKLPYAASAPSGPVSASAFSTPLLASSSTHDLMVVDSARGQLNILDTSGKTASPSAGISFSGTPLAALALPETIDGGRDIVALTAGQSAPILIHSNAGVVLNVNTTADIDSINACTTSTTTIPSTLSLREAVCLANNIQATTTINLPSGTYDLTSLETGELRIATNGGYTLSIIGAGASSTIIQQTDGVDRIFEEDFATAGGNPLTLQNLTLTGGNCTNDTTNDCDEAGGGAILAGGFPNDPLTLTNVVISNNATNQLYGGAVSFDAPNLTVTNSTFSNNKTISAGGGIWFADYAPINETAVVSITNSTFSNNIAGYGVTGNQPGTEGGGLFLELYAPYTSVTVTGTTFTGNTATGGGGGGGIFAEITGSGNPSFAVSNSRIYGNTAGGNGGSGMSIEVGAIGNIENNWWGCNGGPGASGCDTVNVESGVGSQGNFNPWLVLSVSANPTQVATSGASTLTADLTHNSSGTGGFSVPDGTPVTFGGMLDSSVNPTSTTLTSGQATSTYTAGSTSGAGSGTATVDNQTVDATIDVLVSVTVTTSLGNLSITVDGVTATAPQTYNWVVGTSHTVSTSSPQSGPAGSQYVWSNWSQGGAQSQSVIAPSSSTTYTANFTPQYQLTMVASPSADGSVTPTSGQYFASGASVPVTATANSGFAFNNWTSTGGSFGSAISASTSFTMPSAAATVTGNFIPATTQITITTNPANLLVSVDNGSFVPAPLVETWNQNSSHTIATTSPQSGGTGIQYAFSNWSDGGPISHMITVPSTATTYTASFNAQYQLTTVANPSAGGTVSPTSGNYYTSGAVVPLTATANAGYSFNNWTGNVANSTGASTSITMTAPQSVTANFSLVITASPTTTTVSSTNNPSFTAPPGNLVTFTATVTSNSTVNEGTVTFSDPANDFTCSGGNTVAVSNGQASCATSFTSEGARNVTANYNGTVNFQTSNGFITQTVNNHTVVSGNQFCNPGAITIPSTAGAATPYPSNIFVTGLSGNVGAVTVKLNNISSSDIQQTDLLLVGPTGAQIIPFASVGDSSTIGGVNVTLDDSASTLIPGGSPLTTGSYKPTSITGGNSLIFPAPAPLVNAGNYAETDGSATLTSTFQNTAPNGTWALYAMDNAGSGAASIGGGWCVNISPSAVQVTIATSPAGLLVSADGGTATAAPLVESWAPGSSHTITTTSPQSGGTGVQYAFGSWSDGGPISHSITVPSTATTYTASFNTQYQLTTQASPSADGTVMPASGGYYAAGAAIPVTATANSGFTFGNWTATGGTFDSNTAASTSFHMPAAATTVTGNFVTVVTGTSIVVNSVTPSSEVYGQDATVTITAVLSWTGNGPAPTASNVTIGGNGPSGSYGGTSCGAPSGDTLTCSASYTPTGADTVGSYTETASFSGDSNYTGSSSTQSNNFSITQASSTTSVMSGTNPSLVGQSVTFTATIDGQYGLVVKRNGALVGGSSSKKGQKQLSLHPVPSSGFGGTVSWSSNTGCSPTAVSGDPGTAQCSTSTLPQGTDTITATYSGDSNHNGSGGTLSGGQVVNQAGSMTSLMSSKNPSDAGKYVTFTATVSGTATTPTGKVKFLDGATLVAARVLSGGAAIFTTNSLSPGSHSITAVYEGNSTTSGSTSKPLDQVVNAITTTTVQSSQNPSTYGQPVTFTANVNSAGGPPPDGETVTFSWLGGVLGTEALSGGKANVTTTTVLGPGTKLITATYGGDGTFTPSQGTIVQRVTKATTTTTLTSSPNPSKLNQTVIFTVTVTPEFTGTPTNCVTLTDGQTYLGKWTLTNGTVKIKLSKLSKGPHTITATYLGNAYFEGGNSAPLLQQVN